MDNAVKRLYEEILENLYSELKGAKPLNQEQIKRFKAYFQLEEEELGIFYTEFNLIITEEAVFNGLRPFLNPDKITTNHSSPEYNTTLIVYPYFNDGLFESALAED